jgi:hypothetical protein
MTKSATITEAQVSRHIRAAKRNGLRIKSINPDGSIVVETDESTSVTPNEERKQDPYAD